MRLKTIKARGILVVLALLYAGSGSASTSSERNSDLQQIMSAQAKINQMGFEQALAESSWPVLPVTPEYQETLNIQRMVFENPPNELPWDDCNLNPTAFGCTPFYSGSGTGTQASQMKDDAVQILATEVLYQTLLYFKVKNVFGKIPNKGNTYGFKVINPVEGQPYQDLDSDTVIYAIKQFRKYVIGLLCNQPNPARILAMMNRYDVGTRFRWDMAWALLGNDLPDSPNKFMSFGVKWRKFSAALDGIENVSIMRVRNAAGGFSPVNPGDFGGFPAPAPSVPGGGTGSGGSLVKVGFIAKEVIGVIRLAGDIISAILDLVCVSDLSVDQKKEQQKQDVIYKLLEVKRKAYDRYGPLRPILEQIGKKATDAAGRPVTVLP